MNERIKELMVELKKTVSTHRGDAVLIGYDEIEKFAELIVRECIQVGGPEDSYTDDWFKAKADSINKIKQHFGVEE